MHIYTTYSTFTPLGNSSLAAEETEYHPSVGQVKEAQDTQTFILWKIYRCAKCLWHSPCRLHWWIKDGQQSLCGNNCPQMLIWCANQIRVSIFTAEAQALLHAFECIETSSSRKCIIFTDLFSCLQALSNRKLDHPILFKVIIKLTLTIAHFDIHLCWIPSHVGIPGNERKQIRLPPELWLLP